MTAWELAVASALYICVAFRYASFGNSGMAVAFVAYAVANLGFLWALRIPPVAQPPEVSVECQSPTRSHETIYLSVSKCFKNQ